MDSVSNFFIALGYFNLAGVIMLFLFLSEKWGDTFLRKYFEIFSQPYRLGTEGRLWLIWAGVLNLFFAVLNILAARWGAVAQQDLLVLDLCVYFIFIVLSIFALRSPKYSRGIWVNFLIFGFWSGWAIYLLL